MKRLLATIAPQAAAIFGLALATVNTAHAEDLSSFAVLAGSTITNAGTSTINGNVGLSPGTSVTGFVGADNVILTGTLHIADGVASTAKNDLTAAYNILAARPNPIDLTGHVLGTGGSEPLLTPGVYAFDSTAQLTGALTLDGGGDPNAVFIFQIGSSLTTSSASSILLTNGARGANVFFVVGESATLGTTTAFNGNIYALASITLNTSATIGCGSALTQIAAVTLQSNTITAPGSSIDCQAVAILAGTFTDELDETATDNDRAVADAIDTFVDGGGDLPLPFELLGALPPDELAAALTQLSGETATGFTAAGAQSMDAFLAVLNPNDSGRINSENDNPNSPDTVKALGYGPEDQLAANLPPPLAAINQPLAPAARPWSIWGALYGGQNSTDGDVAAGTHDRTASTFGFALGLDYRVDPNSVVGFALAGGGTSFELSDALGTGHSDMAQAAVYVRKTIDANYIAASLAYAWHGVTTDRFVTIAEDDHLRGEFSAHNVAGRVEIGHRLDLPDNPAIPGTGSITPYAAAQVQGFFTPAYVESVVSGLDSYALSYAAHESLTIRTELGVTLARNFAMADDTGLSLHVRAAWAHDYWSNNDSVASFQALPGSSFTVSGAAPASDSLLVSAGAEVNFNRAFSLAGSFDGEFADGSQTYGGKVKARYSW